jgi:hypothetical protein
MAELAATVNPKLKYNHFQPNVNNFTVHLQTFMLQNMPCSLITIFIWHLIVLLQGTMERSSWVYPLFKIHMPNVQIMTTLMLCSMLGRGHCAWFAAHFKPFGLYCLAHPNSSLALHQAKWPVRCYYPSQSIILRLWIISNAK